MRERGRCTAGVYDEAHMQRQRRKQDDRHVYKLLLGYRENERLPVFMQDEEERIIKHYNAH